jgi:bifunctional DNA-binding transcriptional regulator/antitoxin component of YhaV-PrlF toxin-antitoxin module
MGDEIQAMRDALGIKEGDEVVFRVEGQRAVLAFTPDFLETPEDAPLRTQLQEPTLRRDDEVVASTPERPESRLGSVERSSDDAQIPADNPGIPEPVDLDGVSDTTRSRPVGPHAVLDEPRKFSEGVRSSSSPASTHSAAEPGLEACGHGRLPTWRPATNESPGSLKSDG